jgi:hypothetical protein
MSDKNFYSKNGYYTEKGLEYRYKFAKALEPIVVEAIAAGFPIAEIELIASHAHQWIIFENQPTGETEDNIES